MSVYAFECFPADRPEWATTINAASAGKAKTEYFHDLHEAWDCYRFTDVRCRKIGAPHTSDQFKRTAAYRGLPGLRCGARVKVGQSLGTVVGSNCSANFDVLFDADAPRNAGMTLAVHPGEMEVV
jgi:hypothetical protein